MYAAYGITVAKALFRYPGTNRYVKHFNRKIKAAIRKSPRMHPSTFLGLDPRSTCRPANDSVSLIWPHTLFSTLQDLFVIGRPMELDEHFLITWDIDLAVENDWASRLCAIFESVCLSSANRLRAADLKSKVYHDRTN